MQSKLQITHELALFSSISLAVGVLSTIDKPNI